MLKKIPLILLLLVAASFSACEKNSTSACGTQSCTAVYAYVGVQFQDASGSFAPVKDVKLLNLRTNKEIPSPPYPPGVEFFAGFTMIASDDTKSEFSTDGDDIRITATNSTTGQVKSAVVKISGGCNCHVNKISGPDSIVFD